MLYPSPPEPGGGRGATTPAPMIDVRPEPRPAPAAGPFRRLLATVTVALVAGAAGGIAAHQLDQLQQPAPVTTPSPVPSTSQVAGPTLDVAAIAARAGPAIVAIHGEVTQGFATGTVAGTGIVISADGDVLTNAHVVQGATSIRVTIGSAGPRSAQLVGANAASDVALLHVSGVSGLATAAMDTSADVHVGDDVVAIGNALDLGGSPSVTRGIVSATDRSFETSSGTMTGLIQTDAAISSGSSGGALLNARGQVIGITTLTAASTRGTPTESVNFAIPIARAVSVANSFGAGR